MLMSCEDSPYVKRDAWKTLNGRVIAYNGKDSIIFTTNLSKDSKDTIISPLKSVDMESHKEASAFVDSLNKAGVNRPLMLTVEGNPIYKADSGRHIYRMHRCGCSMKALKFY